MTLVHSIQTKSLYKSSMSACPIHNLNFDCDILYRDLSFVPVPDSPNISLPEHAIETPKPLAVLLPPTSTIRIFGTIACGVNVVVSFICREFHVVLVREQLIYRTGVPKRIDIHRVHRGGLVYCDHLVVSKLFTVIPHRHVKVNLTSLFGKTMYFLQTEPMVTQLSKALYVLLPWSLKTDTAVNTFLKYTSKGFGQIDVPNHPKKLQQMVLLSFLVSLRHTEQHTKSWGKRVGTDYFCVQKHVLRY